LTDNSQKKQALKELAIRELARRKFFNYVKYVFKPYVYEKFHNNFFQKLDDVKNGKLKKLMVFLPPRSMKSEAIAKLLPSWYLGDQPSKEVVCASYGFDLAVKHSRECKGYTKEQEFKNIFPDFKLADDKKESGNWETSEGGGYYAVGVGGALTGRGFDLGIIDDPVKNREDAESPVMREKIWDWYTSTFLTRRQGANSAIIILMTRWHTDDLAGRLLEQEGDEWEVLSLPAINDANQPLIENREGFGLEFYEKMSESIGTKDFEALYQQDPIAGSGNIFKKEDFRYFALSDLSFKEFTIGIHVDPAWSTKPDSDDVAVCVTAQHRINKEIYVLDIFGRQILPSDAYAYILSAAEKWKQFAPIDFISIEKVDLSKKQGEFITGFEEYMRSQNKFYTLFYHEPRGQGKKQDRIKFKLEPMLNRHALYFRSDDIANKDWQRLETQFLKFPVGSHDDLADVITQGVAMWQENYAPKNDIIEALEDYYR